MIGSSGSDALASVRAFAHALVRALKSGSLPLGSFGFPSGRVGPPHPPPQGERRPIVAKSVGRCGCSRRANSHWELRGWEWQKKRGLEELRVPPGPLVSPLVPDEDPVVRWPTPVPEAGAWTMARAYEHELPNQSTVIQTISIACVVVC